MPRSGVIDQETLNTHELCYQYSKHGPYFLFGKLRIKYFNDEPHFPERIKSISSQIQMNKLFNDNEKIKRRICDIIMHKAKIITVDILQPNINFYVTFQPKNTYKLDFVDHLWLQFLDQLHSDILFFATITFKIYNILVTKWKHGIGPNDIITFNGEL